MASPYLLLVLSAVFFSSNIIIGRAVHADVPPVALSIWRWTAASLIFLPFGFGAVRRQWRLALARWKSFLAMAVSGMLFGNTVLYMGLKYTTALNAGIVALSRPLLIVMLSWIFLRMAATRRQIVGMAVAMLGVCAIIVRGDIGLLAKLQFNVGDLLVLVSSVGVAGYSVLLPSAAKDLHPNVSVQMPMIFGALVLIPFYGFETAFVRPIEFNTVTVSAVVAVAIFPSILAIWCLSRGLVAIGPTRAAIFNYLTPVCIAIVAIAFLGETLEVYHLLGFMLVVAGIVISTRGNAQRGG
jgi:drug/metabolite transporter (DMT)-like permease